MTELALSESLNLEADLDVLAFFGESLKDQITSIQAPISATITPPTKLAESVKPTANSASGTKLGVQSGLKPQSSVSQTVNKNPPKTANNSVPTERIKRLPTQGGISQNTQAVSAAKPPVRLAAGTVKTAAAVAKPNVSATQKNSIENRHVVSSIGKPTEEHVNSAQSPLIAVEKKEEKPPEPTQEISAPEGQGRGRLTLKEKKQIRRERAEKGRERRGGKSAENPWQSQRSRVQGRTSHYASEAPTSVANIASYPPPFPPSNPPIPYYYPYPPLPYTQNVGYPQLFTAHPEQREADLVQDFLYWARRQRNRF